MAVWTFKDGDKELIEAQFLDDQLAAGWSVIDPSVVVEVTVEDEKPDIAGSAFFEMTNEQIREQAKSAGIEDHATARIHTLKETLNDRPA